MTEPNVSVTYKKASYLPTGKTIVTRTGPYSFVVSSKADMNRSQIEAAVQTYLAEETGFK